MYQHCFRSCSINEAIDLVDGYYFKDMLFGQIVDSPAKVDHSFGATVVKIKLDLPVSDKGRYHEVGGWAIAPFDPTWISFDPEYITSVEIING